MTVTEPPQRRSVEPNWPPLVTMRGPAGACLDDAMAVLAAAGVPFVFAATAELDDRDGWYRWQRGPHPVVLIDPGPEDWTLAEKLGGPIVVIWSAQPRPTDVVDALLRRVRGLVRGPEVLTALAPVVALVSHGYVALPATDLDELAQTFVRRGCLIENHHATHQPEEDRCDLPACVGGQPPPR